MLANLLNAPVAHRFHAEQAPHRLAVPSAKASCNGAMLIPYMAVMGYENTVWGVQTTQGPKEVCNGDWIVEHQIFGVMIFPNEAFQDNFSIAH